MVEVVGWMMNVATYLGREKIIGQHRFPVGLIHVSFVKDTHAYFCLYRFSFGICHMYPHLSLVTAYIDFLRRTGCYRQLLIRQNVE